MIEIPIPSHIVDVSINASPAEADMAIVSVDKFGTPGQLNEYVLSVYGYNISSLKQQSRLERGYALLNEPGKKPILLVVTIDSEGTLSALKRNLEKAVSNNLFSLKDKKVWLPLMGTGSGGLKLEESYNATVQVLNDLKNHLLSHGIGFILSIPNTNEGVSLLSQINDPTNLESFPHLQGTHEKSSIEDIIRNSGRHFFLVRESSINAADKIYQKGLWQPEYDEEYYYLINRVRENDILFLFTIPRSNLPEKIIIKAIGCVTRTQVDGSGFEIDWKLTGLKLSLKYRDYFNGEVTQIDTAEIAEALSQLDRRSWEPLLAPSNSTKPSSIIAGLISDSDAGEDHLDISKDVNAFARVMAAKSFSPPLAVALMGKWGSGKSFFMRKLRAQIESLPQNDEHDIYCEGIAHIHFNAWSYTDANLWASLVTRIFEGLNEYITENTFSDKEKKEVENKLNHELTIAKEEIAVLENQKSSITQQIRTLNSRKKELKNELNRSIHQVRIGSVWEVIEKADEQFKARDKISAALSDNESFIASAEEIKKILPENYWANPSQAYAEIRSKQTYIRQFFNTRNFISNLLLLTGIIALTVAVPIMITLLVNYIFNYDFTLSPSTLALLATAGAFSKHAELTYKRLQPLVASIWKIKESYERSRNEAITKFEQEEKAIKLGIEKNKAEMAVINQQLHQANAAKADLEFKINNALATEALYSFIEKRCNSEDYKKHLGIVSTIRKDFEILNGLFSDHNEESKMRKEADEIRQKFKKPLERIILYIDDLDRCQEENVVQVLEAVNLLMAYPLFIVVVGVDPRWVKNALLKKYYLQFKGQLGDSKAEGLEVIESANYLEKIFQIPFHLKDAADNSVKDMLQKLAQTKPNITLAISSQKSSTTHTDEKRRPILVEDVGPIVVTTARNKTDKTVSDSFTKVESTTEALLITDREIALMQDLSPIIGNNPRAIKRFVNIYRIIKAHEDFLYEVTHEEREIQVVLFLLALPIGNFKQLCKHFEQFINQKQNRDRTLYDFTNSTHIIKELGELKHELHKLLSDNPSFKLLLNASVSSFYQHNQFLKRFTFNSL